MRTRETVLSRRMLSISCQFKQTQTIQFSRRRYQELSTKMDSILRVISYGKKKQLNIDNRSSSVRPHGLIRSKRQNDILKF